MISTVNKISEEKTKINRPNFIMGDSSTLIKQIFEILESLESRLSKLETMKING